MNYMFGLNLQAVIINTQDVRCYSGVGARTWNPRLYHSTAPQLFGNFSSKPTAMHKGRQFE